MKFGTKCCDKCIKPYDGGMIEWCSNSSCPCHSPSEAEKVEKVFRVNGVPIFSFGASQEKVEKPSEDCIDRFAEVAKGLEIEHKIAEKLANFVLYEVVSAKKKSRLAERARIKEVLEIVPAKYWKNPASKGHIIRAIQEE